MSTSPPSLEDRIGELSDALICAETMQEALAGDDALDVVSEILKSLIDDLRCAECVESEADLDGNVASARAKLPQLRQALVVAMGGSNDGPTIERIGEARSALKQLTKELLALE